MMSLNYRLFSFDQNRQVLNAVHEPLTARQLEVLALLCDGLSNKQIARQLNVAAGTVKIHVSNILRAMNVSTRLQAVIAVRSLGLHRFADPADSVRAQGGSATHSGMLGLVPRDEPVEFPGLACAH